MKGEDGEWHLKKTPTVSVPVQQSGPETRTYKGAVYEKGADGEWHVWQRILSWQSAVSTITPCRILAFDPGRQRASRRLVRGAGAWDSGVDFRVAYAAGVSLSGAGQSVGLFEVDGYNASDITNYETLAHMTNAPALTNILVDGFWRPQRRRIEQRRSMSRY